MKTAVIMAAGMGTRFGTMTEERPYLANYAIGLLLVMSLHMFFNTLISYFYSGVQTLYEYDDYLSPIVLMAISAMEILLVVMLYLGSGVAYKLAFVFIGFVIVITIFDMYTENVFFFNIWIQTVLGIITLILLLMPSVRRYYDNYSFGRRPSMDL